VHFGRPQRFIGIDISHTADEILIQQCPLDTGVLCAQGAKKSLIVKSRVQRIPSNVPDTLGHEGRVRTLPSRLVIPSGNALIQCHGAKNALIHERYGQRIPGCPTQLEADTTVWSEVIVFTTDQHLTTHAQMRHQSPRGTSERKPQEFSAPHGSLEGGAL
jgi:hypothetical protein